MSYKILEQNGIDNENVDGGAFNNFAAGGRDGIVGGVLSECALTAAGSAIGVSPGLIILHGIRVKVTGIETLSLSSVPLRPTSYQIVAQVTLASNGDVDFSFFIRTPQPLVQNSLYQNSAGTYQAELASFTHNPDGTISDLMKTLDVIYGAGGGDVNIEVGTVTTETLAAELDADFDVSVRREEGTNKVLLDFDAKIPRGPSGVDEGAVHFNETQDLSDSQKQKAQENIGINPILEQLEDGTYNLVIGLTGDAPSAAAISQINENKINAAEAETATNAKNAETAENSPKSLYNLGAYDTYVDNGDGTITVTRKTGKIDGDNYRFKANAQSGREYYQYYRTVSSENDVTLEGVQFTRVNSTDWWNESLDANTTYVSYDNSSSQIVILPAQGVTPNNYTVIYKTSTDYTETLPANVPINTLDANMSNIVRDEVEKTLNLLPNSEGTLPNSGTAAYFELAPYCDVGKEYTITTYSSVNSIGELRRSDESIISYTNNNQNGTHSLTFTMDDGYRFNLFLVTGGSWNIMLVEGSHAYPFQTYSGQIVHEIQIPIYFSTTNTSPASIIGGDWTSLGSFSIGGNTVYAWRKA